ncbi:MAG: histidine ammonia-lyase [Gemmatimonadales bacterium]|nr:MAG: histidine ammonia-lyase [Gemmatimonadales bacterium]
MIRLTGRDLALEDVRSVSRGGVKVALAASAKEGMQASRDLVESRVARGERVYGVTTGFGRLAEVVISPEERTLLQSNLIRSHAVGVGQPLSVSQVRAIMLLRANALARGVSGVRITVVERLLEMLERDWIPVVPSAGSVGASGDLAPLAHVALTLLGEGELWIEDERRPSGPVLAAAGADPLELRAKEGLALINGTQATTALGILALLQAEDALAALEAAGAMSLESLLGTPEAFRPEVSAVRPHPGQSSSATLQRRLLRDSEIRESHREGDPRIQDAYALRCIPQIHGAARQALEYVRGVLETEANSVTDNPLIFAEAGAVTSAGNFHAQVVSQALDFACIALADLAAVSERRIERLLNPDLSQGLPAFLARRAGLESGYMIAQVTACDLLAEMRVLAHPASVDSVPTSANQEDHISMGLTAARKLVRSVECFQYVVAVELAAAAQGLEYRRPLRAGVGVEGAHTAVREALSPLEGDRSLAAELEGLRHLVDQGRFRADVIDPHYRAEP